MLVWRQPNEISSIIATAKTLGANMMRYRAIVFTLINVVKISLVGILLQNNP